jgi:hypothetical protein
MSATRKTVAATFHPVIARADEAVAGLATRAQEFWDAWAFAAADVGVASEAWRIAARGDKADASAAYRAALDREQQAARVLALRLSSA